MIELKPNEKIIYSRIKALRYAKNHKGIIIRDYLYTKNRLNKLYRLYYYKIITKE